MKVLIITHFYPPLNRMASSRPVSWARIAEELAYEVTVFTTRKYPRHGPLSLEVPELKGSLLEIDYPFSSLVGCGGRSLIGRLTYQIQKLLWCFKSAWILVFSRDLNNEIVISTFSPESTIFLGWVYALSRKNVFWVVDYRDLWTDNAYKKQIFPLNFIFKHLQKLLLLRANLITTVSEPLADQLRKLVSKTPVVVIYNGYETYSDSGDGPSNPSLVTILHSGTIYEGKRDPEPLLQAIRNLLDRKQLDTKNLQLQFLGDRLGQLSALLEKYQLAELTWCPGQVPREQSLEQQGKASLLLMLGSDDSGVLPGKIFEYLGAGKPILSLGDTPSSTVGQLLTETGTGIAVGTDVEQIQHVLLELAAGQSASFFAPKEAQIKKYSRAAQGKRFFEEIERLRHPRQTEIGPSKNEIRN